MVMVPRKVYEAIAEQDGDAWVIRVPEIDRATQAHSLAEAEEMARDLIHVTTDRPADSFDVEVRKSGSVLE
jgi:predicted RNase H-like HicB family nuclease